MDELLDAILQALERKKLSAAAVSEMAVGNPSAIKNLMKRRTASGDTPRNHPIENLIAVADVLGLELYLGPPRHDPIGDAFRGMAEKSVAEDFAFVDRLDVGLSAGHGVSGDNAKPLAPVAFRRDWLRDLYLSPHECVVVNIDGDSMYPTLRDGDLALIDRRPVSDLHLGHIYAIVDIDGGLRAKRIEVLDEGLLLQSDNPEYNADPRFGEEANRVKVLGRVVWSGRKHELALRKAPKRDVPEVKRGKPNFKPRWYSD